MVDRSWNPPGTVLHLLLLFCISIPQALGNGCDRYVKCRSDLLELHWKCAEPSRRFTQHACKINSLYGNHKATSYNIESLFTDCTTKYSAISEIDFLLMTDPACSSERERNPRPVTFSSATCWSDMMRMTQKCFALSRCCPPAQRCAAEVEREVINEQLELEKSQMKLRLEECQVDMAAVLRSPVSKEDAMIARKVSEATKVMLRSVVPFRVYPDPQKKPSFLRTKHTKKPREFAAPLSVRPRGTKRPNHRNNRPGISKPKYSTTVRAGRAELLHAPIDPPTTSLRPFTVLHHGGTVLQTTSQPPAFSPFTFQSIDFDARRNRKLKKNKKRRHRKKKHDFEDEPPFAQASKNIPSKFDAQRAAEKLDRLNGNLKQKGEFGRSILPKMLLVKQNKGKFLGFAQPVIKPLHVQEEMPPAKLAIDQIYDDIVDTQINENELNNSIDELSTDEPPELHFMPIPQDQEKEAFINNNGAWTMEPTTEQTTETPLPTSTLPPPTIPMPEFSRLTFAPFRSLIPTTTEETTTTEEPTTTTEATTTTTEATTTPTSTTTTTEQTTTSSESPMTSEPAPPTPTFSIDPLIDYVTHELLDKHMEKTKADDDEFDFSNADYIDISAMDIEPNSSTTSSFPIPLARYEQANSSSSMWPMDGPHQPHTDYTTTPQLRTTAPPLSPGMLSEQQNSDLIPMPTAAHSFGSIDVTPSPSISTTPLDNQLWPLPIRRRHRLKAMGAKMLEKQKPIVILPMNTKSAKKMEEYNKKKKRLMTGCQRYDKCLRKEVEMRLKCANPYPTPYDKCSAQLLPLYKLIDEASNNKLQFFIRCVGQSQEQNSKCSAQKAIDESEVTCDTLEVWSSYCRQLEKCCPAKDRCDAEAEVDHVGSRLRLLEKSFSLRAAACQFKHAFHRTMARKM